MQLFFDCFTPFNLSNTDLYMIILLKGYGNWSRSTQMKHFMPTINKGLRKLINNKYDTITINECNTSKKWGGCHKDLEYYKDKKGKKVFIFQNSL